jgi:hypothetical protein
MSLSVNALYGANVYINGASFFGQAEEVTLPDLKPVMLEHKAMGMVGKTSLPAGFDKMEARIKFNSIYPEVMKVTADITRSHQVQFRSSLETHVGGNRVAEVPVVAFVRGKFTNVPAINIKQQDNPEGETTMVVDAYRLEIAGEEIFNIDIPASIYRVAGEDKLAAYRANLGI